MHDLDLSNWIYGQTNDMRIEYPSIDAAIDVDLRIKCENSINVKILNVTAPITWEIYRKLICE